VENPRRLKPPFSLLQQYGTAKAMPSQIRLASRPRRFGRLGNMIATLRIQMHSKMHENYDMQRAWRSVRSEAIGWVVGRDGADDG
jgi:hypothetical protein